MPVSPTHLTEDSTACQRRSAIKRLFGEGTRPGYRLLTALVLAVALMLLDHRTEYLGPVRYVMAHVTDPVHYLAHVPVAVAGGVTGMARSHRDLRAENERMEHQLLVLRQRAQRLAVLEAENVRLRELLNSSAELEAEVRVAEIIGIEADPARQEVVINSGSRAGVFEGQAVLDARGLMGQVVEVGPATSRVLLLTDASHALSVQVNRTGVRAILAGTGQADLVRLLYVPDTADIVEGDLLVSSGLDQQFPRGYPVARVVSVTHDPGRAFALIEARPEARVDRASHVMLVEGGRDWREED